MAVQVEAQDKACLAVQDEPEVMFLATNFDDSFIGVPLIRVEIQGWNELQGDILEYGRELGASIADGGVGDLDIHHSTQDKGYIAE